MHFCTFVIIDPKGDPESLVAKSLALFSEDLEVPPYKVYLNDFDIRMMAEQYKLKPHDRHALAKHMHDWMNRPGGVDRQGLYYTTTCNPHGHWDWYEIGGRWNRYIKGARRNVISTKALLKSPHLEGRLPCYVVTPDGTWLEHERFVSVGSLGGKIKTKPDTAWLREVTNALKKHPDSRVVCVDIHH